MPRELAFYGVLFPTLLPILVAVALAYWLLDFVLARFGLYRHVWHPSLFRLSLFVCLFALAARVLGQ